MNYRFGIGYDIHRLVEGRPLFIGGIQIPYVLGLLGHSDGDVLLHAIADAILGAAGESDIGELFPDTGAKYLGASSDELLKTIADLIEKKKMFIGNVDAVIIAEEPKISPFKKQIRRRIAEILRLDESSVNVKAKTNEGLGELGNKEAIAAYAVVGLKTPSAD